MTYNDRREHRDTRLHAWLACLQLELIVADPSDACTSPQSSAETVSQDFCRVIAFWLTRGLLLRTSHRHSHPFPHGEKKPKMEHPCFCLVQMLCLCATGLLYPWSELPRCSVGSTVASVRGLLLPVQGQDTLQLPDSAASL